MKVIYLFLLNNNFQKMSISRRKCTIINEKKILVVFNKNNSFNTRRAEIYKKYPLKSWFIFYPFSFSSVEIFGKAA